ncbi:unnamed protein product [Lepeophtheirus salmonis]|uniref:(salmon louse) hypothetical protein n=1 Tax=Lepeophtheirus salmonis TaxID=72036 RepID=A0A7R8CM91_LEPSM|nr:unnamed protein product [Lepeophtheirus salmonis]CAF2860704.1 unnamed protein product [Lepeophtheirus salmonis]
MSTQTGFWCSPGALRDYLNQTEYLVDTNLQSNIETQCGILFCGTRKPLGFPSAINKRLSIIERDMTLEAVFKNIIGDLDFYSKYGSVAGHSFDCNLRLLAPEYHHKP